MSKTGSTTPRKEKKERIIGPLVEEEQEPEPEEYSYSRPSASHIKNKERNTEINAELKRKKKELTRQGRDKRKREREELGEDAPPAKQARTQENTREKDDTVVLPEDEEILEDEATDEFAAYFSSDKTPKIYITTSFGRSKSHKSVTTGLIKDLLATIPNSTFEERKKKGSLKSIIESCKAQDYTDVMVINEDHKQPNGILVSHLPDGPTALFKLTSVTLMKDIYNHAAPTDHRPEVIQNNFNTRLGHSVARMLACLLPQNPQFTGRRVITFHNQRDFIFFRQHRYIFDDPKKARLQEIGPRFTLKLKYLQHGTFDKKGEYEWVQKSEMVTSRRRFFL